MRLGEAILSALAKEPGTGDYEESAGEQELDHALSLLRREFPDFSILVKGKRVVDYGCGGGRQSVALVLEEGCVVCGIDMNISALQKAKGLAAREQIGDERISFVERPTHEIYGTFDLVISQNAMEHYRYPRAALGEMKRLIHSKGEILITFGPPWFAPYGSHMHFFCKVPWVNIIFSERAVMKVRALYRDDGACRYEDVESGLNRMSLTKFERMIAETGLAMRSIKYTCVKGQDWLAYVPFLRELGINHISCIVALPHK